MKRGRRESELRRGEDEEPGDDAVDSVGGQEAEEDDAEENDGSEAGSVEGVKVDRDEESEEYPVVQNELDNYHNRDAPKSGDKEEDGAEVFQFQPPSLCALLYLNVVNSASDAKRKLKKKAGFAETLKKYQRGEKNSVKHISDKKLQAKLRKTEKIYDIAATDAARSELLLTEQAGYLEAEGELGRTERFTQAAIAKNVDEKTRQKMFDLALPNFGPYTIDYSRNGRHLLIAGAKGHIATMDWVKKKLAAEFHVKEVVKDVKYLHTEKLFAVAQKKHVYIYDDKGIEIHCLKKHVSVNRLEFLPYHFLLASVGDTGWLKYQDISTGDLVIEHRTKLGPCNAMTQNPYNAVIHLGHSNGTVTLWNPNMSQPLVRMLCHRGVVNAMAVDRQGLYMATAGTDAQVKIWDIRTFKPLHAYYSPAPATHLQISQLGLLAVSHGSFVQVWKDALATKQKIPYMRHHMAGGETIHDIAFVPYEDVLGVGHLGGISSLLVPGSGEPNFDSFEANPYASKKQKREQEVHQLLEKIPANMIGLDPTTVGKVDTAPRSVKDKEKQKEIEAKEAASVKKRKKSSKDRKKLRKDSNIWDKRKLDMQEKKVREEKKKQLEVEEGESAPSALARFGRRT